MAYKYGKHNNRGKHSDDRNAFRFYSSSLFNIRMGGKMKWVVIIISAFLVVSLIPISFAQSETSFYDFIQKLIKSLQGEALYNVGSNYAPCEYLGSTWHTFPETYTCPTTYNGETTNICTITFFKAGVAQSSVVLTPGQSLNQNIKVAPEMSYPYCQQQILYNKYIETIPITTTTTTTPSWDCDRTCNTQSDYDYIYDGYNRGYCDYFNDVLRCISELSTTTTTLPSCSYGSTRNIQCPSSSYGTYEFCGENGWVARTLSCSGGTPYCRIGSNVPYCDSTSSATTTTTIPAGRYGNCNQNINGWQYTVYSGPEKLPSQLISIEQCDPNEICNVDQGCIPDTGNIMGCDGKPIGTIEGRSCGRVGFEPYSWTYRRCVGDNDWSIETQACGETQLCDSTQGCINGIDCRQDLKSGETKVTCNNEFNRRVEYCNPIGSVSTTYQLCSEVNTDTPICSNGNCVVNTTSNVCGNGVCEAGEHAELFRTDGVYCLTDCAPTGFIDCEEEIDPPSFIENICRITNCFFTQWGAPGEGVNEACQRCSERYDQYLDQFKECEIKNCEAVRNRCILNGPGTIGYGRKPYSYLPNIGCDIGNSICKLKVKYSSWFSEFKAKYGIWALVIGIGLLYLTIIMIPIILAVVLRK